MEVNASRGLTEASRGLTEASRGLTEASRGLTDAWRGMLGEKMLGEKMLGEEMPRGGYLARVDVSREAKTPWYADIVNYLVCKITPADLTYQQRKKFLHDAKSYYWDEPLLYKHCADGIVRRCVPSDRKSVV